MGRKFSSLLLTGKAATLPFLFQTAHAQQQTMVPSYTDIVQSAVTQIELPAADVSLKSFSSAYNENAAVICTDAWTAAKQTNTMSIVVTGLKGADTVFLATSTSLGGNEAIHKDLKLGTQRLLVPVSTTVTAPTGATVAMTIPLNLAQLKNSGYPINEGGTFYLQTAVFPSGSIDAAGNFDWSKAKLSELDKIAVGKCITSGQYTAY